MSDSKCIDIALVGCTLVVRPWAQNPAVVVGEGTGRRTVQRSVVSSLGGGRHGFSGWCLDLLVTFHPVFWERLSHS